MEDIEDRLVGLAIAGRSKIVTLDDDDISEFKDTDDHLLALPTKAAKRPRMIKRFRAAAAAFANPVQIDIEKRLASIERQISPVSTPSLSDLDEEYKKHPNRWKRVRKITTDALSDAKVSNGIMLEIGGRLNPRNKDFPEFDYVALDLSQHPNSPVAVAVGDITDCPQIPDNSYDFIFSLDVFEHINRPWLAGKEITRILKPGGVTVHSTLFSWRYHPCPGDYFRYTPEGLAGLFPDLECIHKSFDYTERRRNMLGQGKNKLEPDSIGGWRENVRVNYAGRKPLQSAPERTEDVA